MSIPALLVLSTLAVGVWGFLLKKAVLAMPPLAAYAAFGATTLVLLPQLVIYAIFQRHVIAGMTVGAVKG